MKNFAHQWQRKSCFLLLLLAASGSGFSAPLPKTSVAVVKPVAWAITGKVVSANGEPIPGVTVLQKGTANGTATGVDGSYSLNVPEAAGTLVYSFIGYTTQEKAYSGPGSVNVTLTEDAKALEEVVVVGYGTQRKSDLTGSVTAVTAEDFNKGNVVTADQLLTGKVAGVQITSNGGAPGAGSRIRVRGGSSLNASNDPLIVVDGVPLDNSGVAGSPNPLSFINPNDIESFNVLKDASATAIYGSRASNGVIIITTKKGVQGQKFKVGISSLTSVSKIKETIEVLSADQFRALINERGNDAQKALLGSANTNWQNQIYRDAFSYDNNVSFSGGIKVLPYRLSVGYLNQEGILKTSNLKRVSTALSLNPTFLKDHLKVNANFKGTFSKSRFADQGAIGAAVQFDPTQPINADNRFGGYYEWLTPTGQLNTFGTRNPLSILEQRDDRGEVNRSISNLQLDYKFHFLPELRSVLNVGYDYSNSEGLVRQDSTLASVSSQGGTTRQYSQKKENKLLDFYFNYVKEIPGITSRIDATAGYSYQDFLITDPAYPTLSIRERNGVQTTIDMPNPGERQNTLLSYFGRLNYAFKDRYLLTATLRRDGSSRFSPDQRWGTFPSVAVAWRLIEEPFMKGTRAFSDLKLRATYGLTGQQDIGDANFYPYLARYSRSDNSAQYQFGNQFINTLRSEGYDANIKWEETTTYNVGMDFGLVQGRLSGSLDVYLRQTEDLLAEIEVPAGSNLTNRIFTNVGSLENRGIEATLNYTAFNSERFNWDLSLNGTLNKNEITNLSKVKDASSIGYTVGGIAGGVGNTIQVNSVGYPTNSFYVFKQVYDENGKPLEGVYADLNEDGVVNDLDKYRYKNAEPQVTLGFSSQMRYNQWSLGFNLRASLGNYMYNNIYSNTGAYQVFSFSGYLANPSPNVLETNFNNFQLFSDYYMENASFLRMENISLGYDFGQVFKKVGVRASLNGQNVFVITKYKGLDPEIAGGIDNNFYPRPRIFSFGLNLEL